MQVCDFGCGRPAVHIFKSSGKACCSVASSSCPEMKARNSAKKKGINPFEGKEHPRGARGNIPWSTGKTAATDPRLASAASKLRKINLGRPLSSETKQKISNSLKGRSGGYRIGSGNGRKGYYKGIWCDSSWELAFVLWCELNGRSVKRAREKFPYTFNGVTMNYHPDFLYTNMVGAWTYVEVKGYKSEQWEAKLAEFPHKLVLADRDLMETIVFPEVVNTYGKDFLSMYDKVAKIS